MTKSDEILNLQQLDAYVYPFENAWRHAEKLPPAIDDFLPKDGPVHLDLLAELVHVDLERRLMAGLPVSAEDYLKRYPELASHPEIARELIAKELELRQSLEAKPPSAARESAAGAADGGAVLTPPCALGQYWIEGKVGKGGMGLVYRGLHTRLKKPVAIKVLPPDSMDDPRAVARFEREMAAIGQLDHPNIVRATDASQARGIQFLVMDLIEGIDLSKLVKLYGPLSVADACELTCQTASGLQCVHEHRLVHRDLKPSNLLLSTKGELKILDLGLALLGSCGLGDSRLTGSGQAMGTADYMAPEQWHSSHEVDIRADIYSLGCTLYTLLVGQAPFSGPEYTSAPRKMAGHIHDPIKSVRDQRSEVPAAVEKLLRHMTAKEASDRPATPVEVARALEPHCRDADLVALARYGMALRDAPTRDNREPPQAAGDDVTTKGYSTAGRSISPSPRTKKTGPRFRAMAALVGLLVMVTLAAVLFLWPRPNSKEEPKARDDFAVGQWQDLLDRPPTELVWTLKRPGSEWKYDSAQKSLWASCDDTGMLQLGTIARGTYELEVEIFQRSWVGRVGLFFRGRDEGSGAIPRVATEVFAVACPRLEKPALVLAFVDVFPTSQHVSFLGRRSVPIMTPQLGKNCLKIQVGPDGLKNAFWNDARFDSKSVVPEPIRVPRVGPEGSFGIYLANTAVTIMSARLMIHP
jgi:serine/threonine protein kinase